MAGARGTSGGRHGAPLAWAVTWALLFAAYLLLCGSWSRAELLVGAAVAAVGTLATALVWGEGLVRPAAGARLWAQAWRLPGYALTGTWEILGVLARHLFTGQKAESLFFAVRFEPGDDSPRARTRRALAVAYTSATPTSVVVGIDRQRGLLLYHQLQQSEVVELTRRVGARP